MGCFLLFPLRSLLLAARFVLNCGLAFGEGLIDDRARDFADWFLTGATSFGRCTTQLGGHCPVFQ